MNIWGSEVITMMNKDVVLNEENVKEYSALVGIIRDTVDEKDMARICLANRTLRAKAGYDKDSNIEVNPLIKDFLDKLSYDEHNRKVEEAKKAPNSKELLSALSNEAMQMAGYTGETMVNPYAKSFVDRTLLNREMNSLYRAKARKDATGIEEAYRRILKMTDYSSNKTFGVTNQYAQSFVDMNKAVYKRIGIQIPTQREYTEGYAI